MTVAPQMIFAVVPRLAVLDLGHGDAGPRPGPGAGMAQSMKMDPAREIGPLAERPHQPADI